MVDMRANRFLEDETPPMELTEVKVMLEARARQQAAVARLGQQALAGADLAELFDSAVASVVQTLEVEYCKVLELLPEGDQLILRAGIGWEPGHVGSSIVSANLETQAGYTLLSDEPIIIEDWLRERRFKRSQLLKEHDVRSGLSVSITTGPKRPFGILSADTAQKRQFTQDDLYFLQAVANVLAAAIERSRSEETLQERNTLLNAIIEGTHDAIFVKDRQHRYLVINTAGARVFGKSVEEVVGKTVSELMPSDLATAVRLDDQQVLTTGQAQTFEYVVHREGRFRIFHDFKTPYRNPNNEIVGIIGIGRDITDLKRAELAQRILAEAGRVLASSLDYEQRLSRVAWLAVPELADWCSANLVETDGSIRYVTVAHADPAKVDLARELQRRYPPNLEAETGMARALRRGQPELYPEMTETMVARVAHDAEHYGILQGLQMKSAMVVPLTAREQVLGVMTFIWAESGRHYTEEDLELATELARRVAIAIDNARLYAAERTARHTEALLAETRERNRLAQELHDNVAQALGYFNVKLATMSMLLNEEKAVDLQAELQELRQLVNETYTDVREEIFNLRSSASPGMEFLQTLKDYIAKYKRFYDLEVQLIQEAEKKYFEFPDEVGIQLMRTIQEALINVRKHARVNKATIRLGREENHIRISIEDQGQGFEDAQSKKENGSSFGMEIMQERMEKIGGRLEIDSTPSHGTRVTLHYEAEP